MSDHWIVLIPEDPRHVPSAERQERAIARFKEIAPGADEVEVCVDDAIQLRDCGGNLERILCPDCGAEIPTEWWQDRMDDDCAGEGFELKGYATPCCNGSHALHELTYEWPMGFSRFALSAMNPNLGRLDPATKAEFEVILGTPLRVIYRHI